MLTNDGFKVPQFGHSKNLMRNKPSYHQTHFEAPKIKKVKVSQDFKDKSVKELQELINLSALEQLECR